MSEKKRETLKAAFWCLSVIAFGAHLWISKFLIGDPPRVQTSLNTRLYLSAASSAAVTFSSGTLFLLYAPRYKELGRFMTVIGMILIALACLSVVGTVVLVLF